MAKRYLISAQNAHLTVSGDVKNEQKTDVEKSWHLHYIKLYNEYLGSSDNH